MKFTFANMGNYSPVLKQLLERFGLEVILPEATNPREIEEGARLSPELFCLPLKVNIGNYLGALKKGAETILMWENIGGSCRLRYYWLVQEKILREAGFDVKVWNLSSSNLISRFWEIRKANRIPLFKTLSAICLFFKEVSFIEKIEQKARYFRPREKKKWETENIFNKILEKIKEVKSFKELASLKKEADRNFAEIELDKTKEILRIGLVGEIYTLVDGAANHGMERKLGEMGAEVHRKLNISQFVKDGLFPWREWQLQRKINSYLGSTVGGHGRQAIGEILDFVKERFDGVIQLLPFGCLPEVTVRPILQKISQEKKIPFLSISLDEQTAEAGVQTRLEAFIDLLWSRRKMNKSTISL